jgi:hypothetical protein
MRYIIIILLGFLNVGKVYSQKILKPSIDKIFNSSATTSISQLQHKAEVAESLIRKYRSKNQSEARMGMLYADYLVAATLFNMGDAASNEKKK